MPATSASFNSLSGIPTHYARPPVAPYGTRGIQRTFSCDPTLETAMISLINEIIAGTPAGFGALEVIVSAGAFVSKPGAHGRGQAFDIDALFWANTELVTKDQESRTLLYLAIQALCHRHFGVVLGYNYNTAHKDHLHVDLSRSVRFRETKSVTYFLQETVTAIYGESIVVDGEWGNNTAGAVTRVRNQMGIGPLSNSGNWKAFLQRVSGDAFALAEARRVLDASMAASAENTG